MRLDGVEQAVRALARRDLDAFLNDRAAVHFLADLRSTPLRFATSMQWSTTSSSSRWRSSAAMPFRQHLITWFPLTSAQSSTTKGHSPSRMRLTMSGRRQSCGSEMELRGKHESASVRSAFRGRLSRRRAAGSAPWRAKSSAPRKAYELSTLLIAAHLQDLLEEVVPELVGHQQPDALAHLLVQHVQQRGPFLVQRQLQMSAIDAPLHAYLHPFCCSAIASSSPRLASISRRSDASDGGSASRSAAPSSFDARRCFRECGLSLPGRSGRSDRRGRVAGSARLGRSARSARSDRSDRSARSGLSGFSDFSGRSSRSSRSGRSGRPGRRDRSGRSERPLLPRRRTRSERSERSCMSGPSGLSGLSDISERSERSERSEAGRRPLRSIGEGDGSASKLRSCGEKRE